MSLSEMNERLDNQQTGSFNYINQFYLKNDKDRNFVRILLHDASDIEVYSVHNVKMTSKNGKEYVVQVNCLGDNCPMCREALKHANQKFPLVSKARDNVYIPLVALYDHTGKLEPSYMIFNRSTRWYRDVFAGFSARYSIDGVCEIERVGSGIKTTYNIYEARKDPNGKPFDNLRSIEELKEDFEVKSDDIFGRRDSLIKNWSVDDFEEFLETGTYPKGNVDTTSDDEEEEDVRPRSRSSNHGF